MEQAATKKSRYCIIAARIMDGLGTPLQPAVYRVKMLLEENMPRLNYAGMKQLFNVTNDFDWGRGAATRFPELERDVKALEELIRPNEELGEILFVTIRPWRSDVDLRKWGESATISKIY